jgi:hypothetical protein
LGLCIHDIETTKLPQRSEAASIITSGNPSLHAARSRSCAAATLGKTVERVGHALCAAAAAG